MSDLMDALFYYLSNHCLDDYLAIDSEYKLCSAQSDAWALELPEHLDEPGQELFLRLWQALSDENNCKQRALFQATLALCRELYRALLY